MTQSIKYLGVQPADTAQPQASENGLSLKYLTKNLATLDSPFTVIVDPRYIRICIRLPPRDNAGYSNPFPRNPFDPLNHKIPAPHLNIYKHAQSRAAPNTTKTNPGAWLLIVSYLMCTHKYVHRDCIAHNKPPSCDSNCCWSDRRVDRQRIGLRLGARVTDQSDSGRVEHEVPIDVHAASDSATVGPRVCDIDPAAGRCSI